MKKALLLSAMAANMGGEEVNRGVGNLNGVLDDGFAQFNVKVQRVGTQIANSLDVAIFGYMYFVQGYTGVISQTLSGLSSGILGDDTAENAKLANLEALVLTYDNGASSDDVIKITSSSASSYPSFLSATVSDVFTCAGVRLSVPTTQAADHFANDVVLKSETIFGNEKSQRISPNAFINPDQNQSGIVDMAIRFGIDKNTVIKTQMIRAEYTATYSFFVMEANRFNKETLR